MQGTKKELIIVPPVQDAGVWRGLVQLLLKCSECEDGPEFLEACWALVACGAQELAASASAAEEVCRLQGQPCCSCHVGKPVRP